MKSILHALPSILPVVCAWAEKQEAVLLDEGTPLTESQMADARQAGVAHPEKIRVCRAKELPMPDNEELVFMAKQVGLFSKHFTGMTLGYGICIQDASWDDRCTLVHECVHVSQYEKLNGLLPFLSEYLRESIDPGYPFGRLEQEALVISKDICKPATVKLPQ